MVRNKDVRRLISEITIRLAELVEVIEGESSALPAPLRLVSIAALEPVDQVQEDLELMGLCAADEIE